MVKTTALVAASVLVCTQASRSSHDESAESATMLQLRDKREVTMTSGEVSVEEQQVESTDSNTHSRQLAFVEKLAKNMAESGKAIDQTAKNALDAIDETLKNSLNILQDSHDTDQSLLNTLAWRTSNCDTAFTEAKTQNAESATTVSTNKQTHETCREKLKREVDDRNTKCNDLADFVGGLVPPTCNIPDEDLTNYWKNYKSFHDNNFDSWQTKKDACDAATTLGENTENTCDANQEDFESGLCALRLTVVSSCDTYDSCYSVARADFDTAFTTTGKQESQRKVEWTAVKKIQCYIQILLSEEEISMDDIQECVELVPDVSHFDLVVPTVPELQGCDVRGVINVPCNEGFLLNYDGMIGLDDCQACPVLPAHLQKVLEEHAPGEETDNCEGWSIDVKHQIDGTCYMGAYDYTQRTITKTFNLKAGCTYKWKAVIDTWASVDNEAMTFTVNGEAHNFQSRAHHVCNNGWTEYPHDFGDKVGSHGSQHGGWKDCWKNFEADFVAPADGKAEVTMYMAIDQHIDDEGWGWHDMVFEKVSCPVPEKKFAGTCSCTMTCDNDMDFVYINGEDVTSTIDNYANLGNWPSNKVLQFECDEFTRMAVMASDGNGGSSAGCQGGGLGMVCKSSNTASPWHGFESDKTWKAWGGACESTPCLYGGSPETKNVYPGMTADMATWMNSDFDDSAWKNAEQGAHYGQVSGSKMAICSPDGPGWLFRSPNLAAAAPAVSLTSAKKVCSKNEMLSAGWHWTGCPEHHHGGSDPCNGIWCHSQEQMHLQVPMSGAGRCTATWENAYSNCNSDGFVRLVLNGNVIGDAGCNTQQTATFDFAAGDKLEVWEGFAIIKFAEDWIQCV